MISLQTTIIATLLTALYAVSAATSSSTDLISPGHSYVLLANNGKFLTRFQRNGIQYIEAEKGVIDIFCLFKASLLYNGRVALKSDNGRYQFLSRVTRSGQENVEATKPFIDRASQFLVEYDEDGQWDGTLGVYLKANNGKYLGIVTRGERNNIEAFYSQHTKNARFVLMEVK